MEKFESKISNALSLHLIRTAYIGFWFYIIFNGCFDIDILEITIGYFILLLLFYCLLSYLFISLTNHDIIVYENKLEIINKVPLFKKNKTFYFKDINSIQFKEDWTETILENIKHKTLGVTLYLLSSITLFIILPSDYKWININSDRNHRFYCFGLEYDMYDNPMPHFDDLYSSLEKKNVKVLWVK